MKKITVFLCSLALVFSVVGVAGAVLFFIPSRWMKPFIEVSDQSRFLG